MNPKAGIANQTEVRDATAALLAAISLPDLDTPSLCFSRDTLRDNCRAFIDSCAAAFGSQEHRIFFPLKVAPNLELARVVTSQGIGIEAIHTGELSIARESLAPGIIVSGSSKTRGMLESALKQGCEFVVCESMSELDLLNSVAAKLERPQQVLLRLKVTPRRRLGMHLEDALRIAGDPARYQFCDIVGLHVHPGSNIRADYAMKTIELLDRAASTFRAAGATLQYLDFGSGLPTIAGAGADFNERLATMASVAGKYDACAIVEPGRPLVGDAAILIATVTDVRPLERQATVDTACYVLNECCRALPLVYLRRQGTDGLEPLDVSAAGAGGFRFCGIWPAEGDCLWVDNVDQCRVGDTLIFPHAGAYSLGFLHELSFRGLEPTIL